MDRNERQIESTIIMIQSPDEDLRYKGLLSLDQCLATDVRLLSGFARVPQSKSGLIQRGIIRALFNCVIEANEANKQLALVWLIRLSEESGNRNTFFFFFEKISFY